MSMRTVTANDGTATRLWTAPYRLPVVGVLGMVTLIAFESFAVITALPVVATDLGAPEWYSFAFAATIAAGLVGMTIGGNWADRSGVRLPLVVGGLTFLAGLALCAVATNMSIFVVGRLLQGLGGGIDSVVVYVFVSGLIPEHLRPRMFGLMVAAWLLPAMVGPLATGIVVDRIHWRAVFAAVLVGGAAAFAVLVAVSRRLPVRQGVTPVFGRRGIWAVIAFSGIVGLHVAGQQPSMWMTVGTVAGVVVIGVATYRLMPTGTLTARPGVPGLVALKGLLGATVAATDLYFSHFLQLHLGYTPTHAGLLVAIGALGWFAGSWIQGRGPERAAGGLRVAAVCVLVGPVALLGLVSGIVPVPLAVAGTVVTGVGMGLAYPRITASALSLAREENRGQVSSALQSIEQVGAATLTAVIGLVLVVAAYGYVVTYALVTVVAVLAVRVAGR